MTGDWALPGRRRSPTPRAATSAATAPGSTRDDLRPHPRPLAEHDAAGRRPARRRRPPVHALVVYGANPLRVEPRHRQDPARARARRPLHGRDRAVPDGHRRLRRHRPPVDDADRARRRPRRRTGTCTSRGTSPRSRRPASASPHRDLPPAGAAPWGSTSPALYDDDLTLARTLIESRRPDARGHHGRAPAEARAGSGSATRTRSSRSRTGFPDAVGQAGVLLRARGRRGARPAAGLHAARRGRRAGRGPARADRRGRRTGS